MHPPARASSLMVLATVALSSSAPAWAAAPRAPQPSAARGEAPRVDLTRRPTLERLRRSPQGPNPRWSALAVAALRRFVDGVAEPNEVDRAVAKALGGRRNATAIAKRVLARIDALPSATRTKALGRTLSEVPTTAALTEVSAIGGLLYGGIGVTPPDVLPAEGVPSPSSYHLAMSGVRALEVSDNDGNGDELLAMSTVVTAEGNAFVVSHASAPASGSVDGVTTGAATPLDVAAFDGKASAALLVSLVAEVDGDAQAMREEYGVMVGLAQGLAQQLVVAGETSEQRLGHFMFALDYTVGLLALSSADKWPVGSLQKSLLTGDTALHSLYAMLPEHDGAVPWKVTHDHDLPSGRYELYFDVPAPVMPRPVLKLKVAKLESLDGEPGGDDLTLDVAIDNATISKTLTPNKNVHHTGWTVTRKLAPNPTHATLGMVLSEWDEGPAWGFVSSGWGSSKCGNWGQGQQYFACPDLWTSIDLNPLANGGEGWGAYAYEDLRLDVDLVGGKVSLVHDAQGGTLEEIGAIGESITLTGDLAGRRARVTFEITLDP